MILVDSSAGIDDFCGRRCRGAEKPDERPAAPRNLRHYQRLEGTGWGDSSWSWPQPSPFGKTRPRARRKLHGFIRHFYEFFQPSTSVSEIFTVLYLTHA